MTDQPKIQKTDAEWRKELTPEQYHVTREHGTERPWSHLYNTEKRDGVYHCVACGEPLFTADTKFESGSGWPSFFKPIRRRGGRDHRQIAVHDAGPRSIAPIAAPIWATFSPTGPIRRACVTA